MNINNLGMYNYYAMMKNNSITSAQNDIPFSPNLKAAAISALRENEIFNRYATNYTNFDNMGRISAAATIKTDAEDLLSSSKVINDIGYNGVFTEKTAISQDATKITANAQNGAYNTTYSLKVNQIAKAQVNTGNVLDKSQVSGINAGTNTINIKFGDKEKDINFTATAGDTNEIIINKMAKAINEGNTGVKAAIITDNSGIKLQLTAEKTGENNKFTITDKLRNSAISTGISNISTTAVNSKYTLNNVEYSSSSNDVTTNSGKVNFNLKSVTNDTVKVTVKQDSNKITQGIENFVNDYNTLVTDANDNGFTSNSIKGMATSIKNNKYNLGKMGITINKDNTLSVNKNKLTEAIETNMNMVKDTFTGYQGIAKKAELFSKAIERNPFTAIGINTLDLYNKGTLMAYSYENQGSIINLYR